MMPQMNQMMPQMNQMPQMMPEMNQMYPAMPENNMMPQMNAPYMPQVQPTQYMPQGMNAPVICCPYLMNMQCPMMQHYEDSAMGQEMVNPYMPNQNMANSYMPNQNLANSYMSNTNNINPNMGNRY